jgi:hypothetical protein
MGEPVEQSARVFGAEHLDPFGNGKGLKVLPGETSRR